MNDLKDRSCGKLSLISSANCRRVVSGNHLFWKFHISVTIGVNFRENIAHLNILHFPVVYSASGVLSLSCHEIRVQRGFRYLSSSSWLALRRCDKLLPPLIVSVHKAALIVIRLRWLLLSTGLCEERDGRKMGMIETSGRLLLSQILAVRQVSTPACHSHSRLFVRSVPRFNFPSHAIAEKCYLPISIRLAHLETLHETLVKIAISFTYDLSHFLESG